MITEYEKWRKDGGRTICGVAANRINDLTVKAV